MAVGPRAVRVAPMVAPTKEGWEEADTVIVKVMEAVAQAVREVRELGEPLRVV